MGPIKLNTTTLKPAMRMSESDEHRKMKEISAETLRKAGHEVKIEYYDDQIEQIDDEDEKHHMVYDAMVDDRLVIEVEKGTKRNNYLIGHQDHKATRAIKSGYRVVYVARPRALKKHYKNTTMADVAEVTHSGLVVIEGDLNGDFEVEVVVDSLGFATMVADVMRSESDQTPLDGFGG